MSTVSTLRGRGRPAATDRASVVAAALVVLEREGPDALTMRAVAEELGVSHATVHRNVESREKLVELVLSELHRRLPAQMLGEVVEVTTWQDGILLWVEAAYREARTHPGAMQLLARTRFIPNMTETHELLDRIALLAEHQGVPLAAVRTTFAMANDLAIGLAAFDAARADASIDDRLDSDIVGLANEHPAAARLLLAPEQLPRSTRERLHLLVLALSNELTASTHGGGSFRRPTATRTATEECIHSE